jgi:ABC-type Fe3+ transport system substrate-binding protein
MHFRVNQFRCCGGVWMIALAGMLLAAMVPTGCRSQTPESAVQDDAAAKIRAKWGKDYRDLPEIRLSLISAHNESIQTEYARAYSLDYALRNGRRVAFDWRNVGGGGSAIEKFLLNTYARADNSGIDILWGGGDLTFQKLAASGVLEPLDIPADALENIPAQLCGATLIDPRHRWVGSALSGFGFICNAGMLRKCGIEPPRTWDDLGDARFADELMLADPSQSGSAAVAYRMIACSEKNWPAGWAKLLRLLANAKRFTDSAGSAANGPALGESLVATCIDFYGAIRVVEAPDQLAYVSPRGQTVFTADPIGILKNPPHRELAQDFVNFVMSRKGQAMWALPPGAPDGPARAVLGRQPIRRDVYELYAGKMLPWIVNPYQSGMAMEISPEMSKVNFAVLRLLVRAAAIENRDDLRKVRDLLQRRKYPPALMEEYQRLPEDISRLDQMAGVAEQLKDPRQFDRIATGWRDFFREKYQRILQSP